MVFCIAALHNNHGHPPCKQDLWIKFLGLSCI